MVARLVLEQLDVETRCVDADWSVDRDDLSLIEDQLGVELPPGTGWAFDLSPEEFAAIGRGYRLFGESTGAPGRLRTRSRMDDLPYKTHTGRELKLMLAGTKPMAVFSARHGDIGGESAACGQPFDKWVSNGRLCRYEDVVPDDDEAKQAIRYDIYTLPTEAWRANAFRFLKKAAAKSGWSVGMERLEGMLLGYTDEEMDLFINLMFHDQLSSAHSR